MECRANKASALVWRAFPLTTDFRLTDEETSFAVAYATGLTPPYMADQCSSKEGQPLTLEHSVHCLEKLTRHNMIQGRLVSFAREHGVATEQNTRLTFEDCKERKEPDIVFYPACPPIQTDVTSSTPAPQAGSAAAPDRTTGRSRRPWPEKPRSTAPALALWDTRSLRSRSRRTARWIEKSRISSSASQPARQVPEACPSSTCKRIWLSHSCAGTLLQQRGQLREHRE